MIAAQSLRERLRQNNTPYLEVRESSRAVDLAISRLIVRCVANADADDHLALKTMLAQRDFDRAILLSSDAEPPNLSSEIECWHISEIDRLAAELAGETTPP